VIWCRKLYFLFAAK